MNGDEKPMELLIPPKQFKALFPALGALAVATFTAPLNTALREFAIDTPARIAAFLAQIGHESNSLTRWTENLNYSVERLMAVFPKRFPSREKAQAVVDGGPELIAETVYGMRPGLGNVQPGDGWRYRGRGPIQITGRANYAEVGKALGIPLELEPDLAATPPAGFRIAGRYWFTHGCNELADGDFFRAITLEINPAGQGHEDRVERWNAARKVLGLLPIEQGKHA